MAKLMPPLVTHFDDDNGRPLVGGKVYFYEAGTSTLKDTFTDANSNIANTNPVILDARGEASIWLTAGDNYKAVVKRADDSTVRTIDNITRDAADDAVYAAMESAEAARDVAIEQAGIATDQAGIAADEADEAEAAKIAAQAAQALSESARDAALLSRGLWQTTAQGIGKGVAALASVVAGSGGTNGTFPLAFTGGAGTGAAGVFTVAGGAVVSTTLTYSGDSYATPPTVSFAASAGLTGASATAVIAFNSDVGEYFSVPVTGSIDSLILYRVDAGPVATEIVRYPSAAKLAQFLPIAPTGYAWALVDENGLASLGVLDDGTVRAAKIYADEASAKVQKLGSDSATASAPLGYVWALVDDNGKAAIALRADGTLALPSLQASTINTIAAKRITDLVPEKPGDYSAEINHIISYGQSLSIGQSSAPIQTLSQLHDSVMFTAGVRAMGGAGTVAENHASFVPLIEASGSLGFETPCGQAAAQIKNLIESENGLVYTDHTYKILGSAAGQTATVISGLQKGGGPYANLIADVTYGLANAVASAQTYQMQAILWSQGESDMGTGTTYAAYLAAMENLYQNLNSDIKALVGPLQPDIKFICYQTSFLGNTPATVALAQLQASKNNPNIIIAGPNYFIERVGDGVHLTGPGSGMLGAYYGLVYKRVLVDGKAWKPLSPLTIKRQGKILLIKFNVPVRPLNLDTVLYSEQSNSGFSLVDEGGAAISVTSVSIAGPDTVKIVADAPLSAGCKVRYGYNNGGNLRDSQGATLFVQQKSRLPLHNWCVAFEETLT